MSQGVQAKAGGAIHVCAFINISTATDNTFIEASDALSPVMGVTTDAAQSVPTGFNQNTDLAAVNAGDQFQYYPPGTICRVKCSGGWSPEDIIVPTTNGAGRRLDGGPDGPTVQWIGGIALEFANDGEFGLIQTVLAPGP